MREYRAWVVWRGESRWMPLGQHPDVEAAFAAAHKKWRRRLVSVRSVPTPEDHSIERKLSC